MGIIRDMQRVHATQAFADQRANTAAAQQRDLIRRNADLAIAAAQQAAADADRKREHQRLYHEAKTADAAVANAEIRARLSDLDALLLSTLDVDDHIDLQVFKKPVVAPPFDPGPLARPLPEPRWDSYVPPQPRGVGKIIGGDRLRQQQNASALRAFEDARARWSEAEERRKAQLEARRRAYEESLRKHEAKVAAYNAEVDRFAKAVADADPASVVEYFAMVLGNSVYPDDFPQHFRLAYLPKQRHLLIEYHLPPVEVVPHVKDYRYDRFRDDLTAVPRDETEIRRRYVEVIARVTLRTIHEVIEADRGGLVRQVSFNGIVDTIDRRTGRFVRPCLVSIQTERDTFAAIKLRRVDPVACVKHLEGALSAQPDELTAVPEKIDFDRDADRDFTEEFNVLAEIDERPNLVALTDTQWEQQLADLFGIMGLQMGAPARGELGTRWLATDPRPIFGGPVVIFANRGAASGAAAVHALAGAVTAAGATKGILVSLGGIEPAAYEAVAGRPLELIDGPALVTLLSNYCRVKARIELTA
ncbi:restriction endonuclease [Paractinoplanes brasiliensis]|uniref:Restriction system protein n=1 Tax=Paractinoplanes brasiliensis TaxID=52695 RepID=A0A4V3C7P2_9ACTN|nr:restriction endonuclease [Actinoplanes brasiliensis]TDO38468.1 restriction system protein [Actinoplanes brasiliensis]GID26758.1 restriction endonuclease [Actinoplanes brasiliensis]